MGFGVKWLKGLGLLGLRGVKFGDEEGFEVILGECDRDWVVGLGGFGDGGLEMGVGVVGMECEGRTTVLGLGKKQRFPDFN